MRFVDVQATYLTYIINWNSSFVFTVSLVYGLVISCVVMAPKQQLLKDAWDWARTTKPDDVTENYIETAYRIHLAPCPVSQHSRHAKNCVSNPNCLFMLGEKPWFSDVDEDLLVAEDLEREQDGFVGLHNLGATCYLNAFLQVWYHNRAFRNAVLQWTDPADDGDGICMKACRPTGEDLRPRSIAGHLQLIFARLLHGKRRSFAPTDFVKCLELDTDLQQDAQEFSKLLLTCLEKDENMRSIIQSQYMGRQVYVTECKGCGREAVSQPTELYEILLNIKGHKELSECFDEYFEGTLLNGDNQYHCSHCDSKQDAVHKMRLQSLPPVLNIQLARFVFEKLTKRKLSTYVIFPETLDMSPYLPSTDSAVDAVYSLFAVLYHTGPSASSGHYVALIRDSATGNIYKFNDTDVEKIEKTNFGVEEDSSDGVKKDKRPKVLKGYQASRTAYMLVYRLRSLDTDVTHVEVSRDCLPERVQSFLHWDEVDLQAEKVNLTVENVKFTTNPGHAGTEKLQLSQPQQHTADPDVRAEFNCHIKDRTGRIRELYEAWAQQLSADRAELFEWVSTQWLVTWMDRRVDKEKLPPVIDNKQLLCHHQKLSPESVEHAKLIPVTVAEQLMQTYPANVRLPCRQSLCKECVVGRCYIEYHKEMFYDAEPVVLAAIKSSKLQASEKTFWLSRTGVTRRWKTCIFASIERFVLEKYKYKIGACLELTKSENTVNSVDKPTAPGATASETSIEEVTSMSIDGSTDLLQEPAKPTESSSGTRVVCLDDVVESSESGSSSESSGTSRTCSSTMVTDNGGQLAGDVNEPETSMVPGDVESHREPCQAEPSTEPCNSSEPHKAELSNEPCIVGKSDDGCKLRDDPDTSAPQLPDSSGGTSAETSDDSGRKPFNSEILCEHGHLKMDEKSRVLVSSDTWHLMTSLFLSSADYVEKTGAEPVCELCKQSTAGQSDDRDKRKMVASLQKCGLSDLFTNRNRPTESSDSVYVVSNNFVTAWRKFIKDPAKNDLVLAVFNHEILCEHKRQFFQFPPLPSSQQTSPPNYGNKEDELEVYYLRPDEWETLKFNSFDIDHEIMCRVVSGVDGQNSVRPVTVEFCEDCCCKHLAELERMRFEYENGRITVIKVTELNRTIVHRTELGTAATEFGAAATVNSVDLTSASSNIVGSVDDPIDVDDDSEQHPAVGNKRKQPLADGDGNDAKLLKLDATAGVTSGGQMAIRRSTRKLNKPMQREFIVSSSQTLRDIKKQIARQFDVMTSDQHLFFNNMELTEDDLTLEQLAIPQNTELLLKVDEPLPNQTLDDLEQAITASTHNSVEKGFKGTALSV